ncbi:acyltransferase family protein [Glacieibacterium megasporae]|uniref:acyltransferase family protein n=1 Tax=Glacieibacterium megasporae TaxID=2835787 RepID=UPI001C1DF56D|nr:acyltransferase [Polymorphobacter megasporae]UAJ11765.1 acyltransferase [Polymorphobacter megasporae]
MSAGAAKSEYFAGLDLLRFAAAGLVVADHFGLYAWAYPSATGPARDAAFGFLEPMSAIGSIGVEIFFLISGFVIAASAVGSTPNDFALRRAIRVFPALWISGLVAGVAMLSTGAPLSSVAADYARYAVLSPVGPYIDGVVWTLIVEAVFYALIYAVLWSGGTATFGRVAKVLGVLSALYLIVLVAAETAPGPAAAHLASLLGRFPFKVFLLRHGVLFAVGMLIWSGFDRGFTRAGNGWIAVLLVFCSLEICIDRPGFVANLVSLALWWASLGVLLVSVARSGWIKRYPRQVPMIRRLGRLSYPVYLNHYTLGLVVVPALAALGWSRPLVFFAALAIVLLVSSLIMAYPERLLQTALKNAMRGWHNRREVAATTP